MLEQGFHQGGRFGNGRNRGQQGEGQNATNGSNNDGGQEDTGGTLSTTSLTILPADVKTSAPLAGGAVATNSLSEITASLIAASPTFTGSLQQSSGDLYGLSTPQSSPATLVGIPYMAPSITANIQSLSLLPAPVSVSSIGPVSSLTTTRLTVTSAKTVFVSSTSLLSLGSISAEAESSTSVQATQAPSLDLAPLPTTSRKSLAASEKAGLGIGITLVILLIAGAVAYGLYRRRTMGAREPLSSETDGRIGGPPPRRTVLKDTLAGFFGSRDKNKDKGDPEWSIESAEQVSIVRAGSVKSIESQPRAMTPQLPDPALPPSRSALSGNGTELLKVGMTMPERIPTQKLADLALRSNPPVSPSLFPSPPRAGKVGSWPLPE